MSLLLDALKKAEEAKRLASAPAGAGSPPTAPAPPGAELSLEPVHSAPAPTATPPGSPLPDLSAPLDTVDADLAAVSTAPPRRPPQTEPKRTPPAAKAAVNPAANPASEQEAVRNVFAAKRTPAPNRTLLWLALGAVALLAIAIGGWFWWQLQSIGSSTMATRAPQPVSAPSQSAPPIPAPLPPQVASAPAAPITGTPPAATSAADTQEAPSPPPEPARNERRAAPQAEPEGPVRISRGELKVQPALLRAVELLETDDLAGATRAYEQVLRGDARNSDALLGMAAIAIRQNDLRSAEGWYLRALEADPKDINALAGLINLRGQADPQAAESRIKGLLASQPDSPTLNFALGNLYAGQRRWPEAQLAYFNAHTADPTHPDYLFNLATSLDHMHLPKVALDYYKSALAASGSRRPSFNPDQVKARILELQP